MFRRIADIIVLGFLFVSGLISAKASSLSEAVFYHTDHLGSSSVITDSSGAENERIAYYPYGETWKESSVISYESSVNYKYTGQEEEPEISLYYYGARYYDQFLARFISADLKINYLIPQDQNLYSYAGNNPVRHIDPDGRSFWDVVDVVVFMVNWQAYQDDPSGENLFWVVVSGVGLLPIMPSGGYFSPSATAEATEAYAVVASAVKASKISTRVKAGSNVFLSSQNRKNSSADIKTQKKVSSSRKSSSKLSKADEAGKSELKKEFLKEINFRVIVSKVDTKFRNQYSDLSEVPEEVVSKYLYETSAHDILYGKKYGWTKKKTEQYWKNFIIPRAKLWVETHPESTLLNDLIGTKDLYVH